MAAGKPKLEEFCAVHTCRKDVSFVLQTKNGPKSIDLPQYWPPVRENYLSILPDEKIYVELEITKDNLIGLKHVPSIKNPDITLTFNFEQVQDKRGMMLTVKNPFDSVLKFHVSMAVVTGEIVQTSSCPVRANLLLMEHWPHPIFELFVSDIHFLAKADSTACVY
ncbi:hypothetical protein MNBD_ALPHA06-178 [hydrothermal vent metagenome]|uniref:Uncharacterized protein n=1 Tax=hydrothermal vent metagenome TaxID=652676 RepID=A0A3B0RSG8_9ZZZZ